MSDATEPQALRRLVAALEAAIPWDGQEPPPAITEEVARAMLAAPGAYWRQMPDEMAREWREWALSIIEPIDHAPFFELLRQMKDAGGRPDSATMQRLVELAPPRFLDAAASIVEDAMPTPTHCDAEGNPVFSAQEIAEHFGVTPEEVERDIERLELNDRLYTDPVHALQ